MKRYNYWTFFDEANGATDGGGGDASGGASGGESLNVDIGAAADAIGADLGLGSSDGDDSRGSATPSPDDKKPGDTEDLGAAPPKKLDEDPTKDDPAAPPKDDTAAPADFPSNLPKELAQDWAKTPESVRAHLARRESEMAKGLEQYKTGYNYGKQLNDVLKAYQPLLDAQKVGHADAVKYLMNAHYVMSTGNDADRTKFFAQLMKQYNVVPEAVTKAFGDEAPLIDPKVSELEQRISAFEMQQKELNARTIAEAKAKVDAEVQAFASDPKHPYFNEVADHIALLLRDPRITLEQAYEQAVWANPLTRAKEQARLHTEATAASKKAAEEEAAKKAAARGTVVKGRDSGRSAPDFIGTLDDTLRDTLKEIRGRT